MNKSYFWKMMGKYGIFIFSVMSSGFVQGAETATANVNITVSNSRPTCDISVRSDYPLVMEPGNKKYESFPVSINCTGGAVKTALTAQNVGGGLQSNGYQVAVSLSNSGVGAKPLFWLVDNNNQIIYLTGGTHFCEGNQQNRSCDLKPVTNMRTDAGWGNGSVTIRFNIVYPA